MKNLLWIGALVALFAFAGQALAQDGDHADEGADTHAAEVEGGFWVIPAGATGVAIGASFGAGLIVIGAAKGIGNIGGNAVQAIARQPEAGGRIFTSMLISAALIEGFTFFALLIPFLARA